MRHDATNPYGKCDFEIKVCIDEHTSEEIVMLARLSNQTKSEYVRHILHLHVYGYAEHSRMLVNNGTAGIGKEQGRNRE
ncbi:MAG: hypothetical protein R8M45_02655 [Ghiorsea sp.]